MSRDDLIVRTARALYFAEAKAPAPGWLAISDEARAVWLRRAKVAVLYAWPDIARAELKDAAEEIDWQFEVFTASDGIPSIRQHGKSSSQLLEERAEKVQPEESWPDVEYHCANDGEELSEQGDPGNTFLWCSHCGRQYTFEGRPIGRSSTHMKRAVKRA